VDVFVLQRPPETSWRYPAAALAVHADPDAIVFQYLDELSAGKLTPLVRVENLRPTVPPQRHGQRVDAVFGVHRINHAIGQYLRL